MPDPLKHVLRALLLLALPLTGVATVQDGPEAGLRILVVDSEAEASRLRARAESGESFEDLAATYSQDPSGESGGFIGIVAVRELSPEYQEAIRGLEPGDVSDVTQTGGDYVLLQLVGMGESRWIEQTASGLRAFGEGRLVEAEELLSSALSEAEKLGRLDYRVHLSLNNLASVHRLQGEYEAAEPLYQRALEVAEEALGPDHPDLAASLNNLALLYSDAGNYDQAEVMLERAQEILVQAFGPNHPNVGVGFRNLARLRRAQGNAARAESLYQIALSIFEQALGAGDVSVAETLDELAGLLREADRGEEAAPLEARAGAIRDALGQ